MAIEIERRFLIDKSFFQTDLYRKSTWRIERIRQGYLSSDKRKIVRIRTSDTEAWITVKGMPIGKNGISCEEIESNIDLNIAHSLLDKFCINCIQKYRYFLNINHEQWVIDEFLGENNGLIIAELELESEDQEILCDPFWIKEISGDSKYSNFNLSINPYCLWN